jgi:hypothetical protein
MNRYKVKVNLYLDAEREEAEDFASRMLSGTEIMTRMWDVDVAEKRFEHVE